MYSKLLSEANHNLNLTHIRKWVIHEHKRTTPLLKFKASKKHKPSPTKPTSDEEDMMVIDAIREGSCQSLV